MFSGKTKMSTVIRYLEGLIITGLWMKIKWGYVLVLREYSLRPFHRDVVSLSVSDHYRACFI